MNNKKNIKVTTFGTASVLALSECEQKTFYTTLLNRIQELYKNSK